MESQISLALAEKLRRMFENAETFLTFPQGVGFTYRYLNFMKDPSQSGLSLQEQLANKADFARQLNIVPADSPVFSNDASQLLWSRTIELLNAAVFADSALTADEEARLAQAIDYLTDNITLDDGTQIPVNSEVVTRYYEYKTLYDQAEATYLDEKISVESATGPEADALKQRWQAYRERQLQDAVKQALANWQNQGCSEQVRSAQQVRSELEPKKYLNLYRSAYLNDIEISELPDLNGMGLSVYPTFFSPFDVFDPALAWNRLTLTRAELATLLAGAPPVLRNLFGANTNVDDFTSVTLEYTHIAVIRPWYKPEFFASRYWKTGDGSVVSDGKTPRNGSIPGYITSMLVTRNVTVTRKQARPANAPALVLPLLGKAPLSTLKAPERVLKLEQLAVKPVVRPMLQQAAPVAPQLKAAQLRVSVARPAARQPVMAARPASAAKPAALAAAAIKTSFVASPTARKPLAKDVAAVQTRYLSAKYLGSVIKAQPCVPPPTREPASTFVTERYAFDGVIVLAFVCKRVPRCPNPDPALHW